MNSAVTEKARPREHEGMLGSFEQFERGGQGATPSWLQALHKGGIAHFAELGFPNRSHEEWRFTNVAPIVRTAWELSVLEPAKLTTSQLDGATFPDLGGKRLVFVDGRFSRELSTRESTGPNALRVTNLHDAVRSPFPLVMHSLARYARYDDNAFAALNTAFLEDGAVLVAPPGYQSSEAIYIVYISTGARANVVTHPRTLILAQRDSQLRVVEHFLSLGREACFTNSVTELVLEDAAQVEHCKIQEENQNSFHIATVQAQQARSSRTLLHSISIGSAVSRNNVNVVLDGERSEATLNGLYLGSDSQVVDHHTAIYHNKPNCNSFEYYHGILDGRAHGIFNGKIFVRPEAQKTDAKQTNRNLLLSDDATIDTKPQLEIFADDVKCTHGATIGQLDPESIFYLRARGISLETARKMLLHAFASEIVNRITVESVREKLNKRLFEMYER